MTSVMVRRRVRKYRTPKGGLPDNYHEEVAKENVLRSLYGWTWAQYDSVQRWVSRQAARTSHPVWLRTRHVELASMTGSPDQLEYLAKGLMHVVPTRRERRTAQFYMAAPPDVGEQVRRYFGEPRRREYGELGNALAVFLRVLPYLDKKLPAKGERLSLPLTPEADLGYQSRQGVEEDFAEREYEFLAETFWHSFACMVRQASGFVESGTEGIGDAYAVNFSRLAKDFHREVQTRRPAARARWAEERKANREGKKAYLDKILNADSRSATLTPDESAAEVQRVRDAYGLAADFAWNVMQDIARDVYGTDDLSKLPPGVIDELGAAGYRAHLFAEGKPLEAYDEATDQWVQIRGRRIVRRGRPLKSIVKPDSRND